MIQESVYLHYLSALLEGDKKECLQIVQHLVNSNVQLKEIYMDLFQRSMYRIGQMWEKERCSIADEHIATKITESLIEYVSGFYNSEKREGKLVLVTCIDKEFHELGARMVAGYFESAGWDTIFAGSNVPEEDVLKLIYEKKPDVVGLSSSFYINVNRLIRLVRAIKQNFPGQEILIGGQALANEHAELISEYAGVSYITCINGLQEYLSSRKANNN